ncbi:MAG: CxxxxCH/CxxCH domain c-type cytochrome [Thermodesulfobacteriota bacterium]
MKMRYTLSGFMIVAGLLSGNAALAAQSPHWLENNIYCLDCHSDHQGATTACTDCHDNDTGGNYSKLDAPAVQSHAGFSCVTCHDPHTSAQCTLPLVTGSFSGYQVGEQTTTFTLNALQAVDPAWSDPAGWSAKSGPERGLILTVALGWLDNSRTPPEYVDYSAEVVAADATSITVQGTHAGSALSGSQEFSLIFGQLIASQINGRPVVFSGPASFAASDGLGPDGGDATPDGVCQVCHSRTRYWRNDGSLAHHNNGQDCTICHEHQSGFNANCDSCHGNPPVVDTAQGGDGLVAVPAATGSVTAGAHAVHATGAGYGFGCDSCHAGGMPASPISDNNRIQIGFGGNPAGIMANYDGQAGLQAPYTYEGTGDTTVTGGGSLTCSNVYCHSNGAWVSTGIVNSHASPSWDTQGPLSCGSCHPYPMATGADDPRKDTHARHAMAGYADCRTCHYQTTTDGATIHDRSRHANRVYDVVPAPTFAGRAADGSRPLAFTYSFAQGGGSCSANSCHAYWGYSDPARWGVNSDLVVTPYVSALPSLTEDRTITFDASRSSCYENVDGVAQERVCSYSWDFGGSGSVVGGNGADTMIYQYGSEGSYTATLTLRESLTGKAGSATLDVTAENVAPPPAVVDFATTVTGRTVKLAAALPADVVRLYVYWGDGKKNVYTSPATAVMTHTYSAGGRTYTMSATSYDAAYHKVNYTVADDPDLSVFIP